MHDDVFQIGHGLVPGVRVVDAVKSLGCPHKLDKTEAEEVAEKTLPCLASFRPSSGPMYEGLLAKEPGGN